MTTSFGGFSVVSSDPVSGSVTIEISEIILRHPDQQEALARKLVELMKERDDVLKVNVIPRE